MDPIEPMDSKERSRLYIQRLLGYEKQLVDGKFYSIQRIDLLIISLSGGGIYLIFEMIKFIKSNKGMDSDISLLRFSGIAFALAIIINFISQWTGYKANQEGIAANELHLTKEKGDQINEGDLSCIKRYEKTFNSLTAALNTTSTILMIAGIVMLTIFGLSIS